MSPYHLLPHKGLNLNSLPYPTSEREGHLLAFISLFKPKSINDLSEAVSVVLVNCLGCIEL